MDDQIILTGVLVDEDTPISFIEVCQKYNLSEELLSEMIEHGLFTPLASNLKTIQVTQKTVWRIQSARRLQQDLALNLPGAVLVLELLDELERMRNELRILEHHRGMADKY